MLRRLLGLGGNAEVWLSVRPGETAAVKILGRKGDRYLRFRSEVSALTKLGRRPGILPLLDSHLPDNPTKADPAWLAMPVATPLADAIKDDPGLESAVRATADIAECLATLHAEGVAHRDIKPSNLYVFDGAASVGDFGLVDYPEKVDVTSPSDEVGSRWFIAPEMTDRPDEVHDARPADVYSLSKVLFCLASRRERPPVGQIRVEDNHSGLLRWVRHEDARSLAQLIEQCTANDPSLRPAMAEFARELRAWVIPSPRSTERLDFSHLRAKIGRTYEPAREARRKHVSRRLQLASQVREVVLPLRGFQEGLADIGFQASSFSEGSSLPPQLQLPAQDVESNACELRCRGPGAYLTLTLAATLAADDTLTLVGAHVLRPTDVAPGNVLWSERIVERFLSVQQRRSLLALVSHFEEHLKESADTFVSEFKDGVTISDPPTAIARYSLRSINHNPTDTKGEILVAFARRDRSGEEVLQNHLLRPDSYDPEILVGGDAAIEREARIQMALAGVR
jgi:serine/threonine protein kinase